MPVNRNPQVSTSVRGEPTFDESVSELAAFSSEQLAAMNKVLIALLHAVSLPDLLESIHRSLSTIAQVSACGHYVTMQPGHLRLDCGAGAYRECLPDVIPSGSDVLASIRSSSFPRSIDSPPMQPSLFDDAPVLSFWAIENDGAFAGAFACVYAAQADKFINAVCSQIVVSVDALYKQLGARLPGAGVVDQVVGIEPISSVIDRLTEREQEVLALVCKGLGNKEIAAKLYISVATCKHHVENILTKLGVHTRAAAVAVGLGLARPRSDEL